MGEGAEASLLRFVRRVVAPGAAGARIRADTPLFNGGRIDSMNVLKLIGYVERRLGRRLRASELVMANFRSVRTISRRFLRDAAS